MANQPPAEEDGSSSGHWFQRFLDNLWILLLLGILIPAILYLAWGLWELVELPTWGGE